MPQVPYKPVPTASPEAPGAPEVRVRTPDIGPDAFGYQIGSALREAGTTMEGVGSEMFNRAEAFQDLENRNQATMAAADYEKAATQADFDFRTNEGKSAVDAYKTYDQKLEEARQKIGARLTNPDAKRFYDSQTKSIFNKAYWEGAHYATGEMKKYTDAANNAQTSMDAKNVTVDTKNYEIKGLDTLQKNIQDAMQGRYDQTTIDTRVFEKKSTAIRGTLFDLARADPWSAKQTYDKYESQMTQDDKRDFMNYYVSQSRQITPRNVYAGYMRGDYLTLGEKKIPIERLLKAVGGYESDNNYNSGLDHIQRGIRDGPHGVPLGRYQVMSDFLAGYLKRAGLPSMTPEEFIHNRAAQDQVARVNLQALQDQYGTANDAASAWLSGQPRKTAAPGVHDANGTTVPKYVAEINARLAKDASEREMTDAVNGQVTKLVKETDDPLIVQYSTAHTEEIWNHEHKLLLEEEQGNRHTAMGAILEPREGGRLVTTRDEAFKDPKVQEAFNHMSDADKLLWARRLGENARQKFGYTDEAMNRYDTLLGMSGPKATPEAKEEFSKMNLLEEHLPREWLKDVIQRQKDIWKTSSDTHVASAFNRIARDMTVPKPSQKNAYHNFNGALGRMMQEYETNYQKRPDEKAILQMGRDLTRKMTTGGWSGQLKEGGYGSTQLSQVAVPPSMVKAIRAQPEFQNASDQVVHDEYVRFLVHKLEYEGKEEKELYPKEE